MLVTRKARREDAPVILQLIRDLAAYEKAEHEVTGAAEDLARDGFGEHPSFHVLLALKDGEPIGFAFYFFTYSTWLARRTLHLEDLFVKPEHRGGGAGLLLMKELAREAVAQGCARFDWQVLDWNEPAIGFYERLGARVMREWLPVRLEGEALTKLGVL